MSNAQNQVKAIPGLKKNAITEEYKVTNQVLGMGINGRVLEIFRKSNGQKYALKVINLHYFVNITICSLFWFYLWAPPFYMCVERVDWSVSRSSPTAPTDEWVPYAGVLAGTMLYFVCQQNMLWMPPINVLEGEQATIWVNVKCIQTFGDCQSEKNWSSNTTRCQRSLKSSSVCSLKFCWNAWYKPSELPDYSMALPWVTAKAAH